MEVKVRFLSRSHSSWWDHFSMSCPAAPSRTRMAPFLIKRIFLVCLHLIKFKNVKLLITNFGLVLIKEACILIIDSRKTKRSLAFVTRTRFCFMYIAEETSLICTKLLLQACINGYTGVANAILQAELLQQNSFLSLKMLLDLYKACQLKIL